MIYDDIEMRWSLDLSIIISCNIGDSVLYRLLLMFSVVSQ